MDQNVCTLPGTLNPTSVATCNTVNLAELFQRFTSVTKERTNERATDKRNVKTNQRIKKDARDQSKKETRT